MRYNVEPRKPDRTMPHRKTTSTLFGKGDLQRGGRIKCQILGAQPRLSAQDFRLVVLGRGSGSVSCPDLPVQRGCLTCAHKATLRDQFDHCAHQMQMYRHRRVIPGYESLSLAMSILSALCHAGDLNVHTRAAHPNV
eukprot:9477927-Pyramimonas_sp.AAC.2